MRTSLWQLIPPWARSVVLHLEIHKTAVIGDIVDLLGISISGARQHMSKLVRAGVAVYEQAKREPGRSGRARHIYRLTPRMIAELELDELPESGEDDENLELFLDSPSLH